MLAVWMIGIVNWREYWMNACDVAERHLAGRHLTPPMTQIAT